MISFISWTLLIFKYPLHVIQNNCSNLTISRLLDSQNEIQLFIYIFGQSFFTFILHILSDHSYGILKPAVEYKINKNACSKREKQRDVVCPWSIWLIGCRPCPTLLRIKYIKVQGSCCWMFSCLPSLRVNEEQLALLSAPKGHSGHKKEWFYRWQTLPCLQERNALLLMLVVLVQRLHE